jgi:hypothetical protein
MRRDTGTVPAAALLETWESGEGEHPLRQALVLLQLAEPDAPTESLAALTIGERNRRLLALRQRLIGPRFDAVAACPQCGERLELTFDAAQISSPAAPGATDDLMVEHGGYRIRVRVPASADLLAVIESADANDAAARLLARCTLSLHCDGKLLPVEAAADLPQEARDAIQRCLGEADPMGDLQLALQCPACSQRWDMTFDIAAYLWDEVSECARRLLVDVHRLARAYGWRESDILALPERRRQHYLEVIAGE